MAELANNSAAIRSRKRRQEHPEKANAAKMKWGSKNPEKRRAHWAVDRAIRAGRLQKLPCERCGTAINVHAHHDDYSDFLAVRWLCAVHHRERHRELELADESARPKTRNKFGYRGVSQKAGARRYTAGIVLHGEGVYLGVFDTAEQAAMAVDEAARKHYGHTAILNFPQDSST